MENRPTGAELSALDRENIRLMSYHTARIHYRIGYGTWSAIRGGRPPSRTARCDAAESNQVFVDRVLESVRTAPHLNTAERARSLGLRTEVIQRFLKSRGLSRLGPRLEHAGYKVELIRPLQVARLRRVLALYPGAITHIDFKTFGFLQGRPEQKGFRVGGYTVIDSFTGFACVHLAPTANAADAVAALGKFERAAPFPLAGVVFSDNGPSDFLSDAFIEFVHGKGWVQRTTRFHHPWSNGKAEALNKVLKYQCFPAITYANCPTLRALQEVVDTWMQFYNDHRAHTGFVNRGLPPRALFNLWQQTPGSHAERIERLGIARLGPEWKMRLLGSSPDSPTRGLRSQGGEPVAVVFEKDRETTFTPATEVTDPALPLDQPTFVFQR